MKAPCTKLRRARISSLSRGLAALLVLSLPFVAPARAGEDRTDDDGGFSDEMVGTLPSMGGWHPVRESGYDVERDAGFFLRGPVSRVVAAVQHAAGQGYLTFEITGPDEIRVDFHGRLRVPLEPSLFADGAVTAGLHFGTGYGFGAVSLSSGGRTAGPGVQGPGSDLLLPVMPLHRAGVLLDGLEIHTWSRAAGSGSVSLHERHGSIQVEQTP